MSDFFEKHVLGEWTDAYGNVYPNQAKSLTAMGFTPHIKMWQDKYVDASVVEVTCPPMTTKVHFSNESLVYKYGGNPEYLAKYVTDYTLKSIWDSLHEAIHKAVLNAMASQDIHLPLHKMNVIPFAELPGDSYLAPSNAAIAELLGTAYKKTWTPKSDLGADVLKTLSNLVPNITTTVDHPNTSDGCLWGAESKRPISQVVMHLNDTHKWTRDSIADWLETLDVDLSFKTPEGD